MGLLDGDVGKKGNGIGDVRTGNESSPKEQGTWRRNDLCNKEREEGCL